MTLILDAGAFLAVESGDRGVAALLKRERGAARRPLSHGAVVAQVWRGGSRRQANVARLLPTLEIRSVDEELGKRAGVLLGLSGTADAVDALVVLLARDGDEILTSDPDDLRVLARAADLHVDIVPV